MDRIYHPWDKWECYRAGFFKSNVQLKKEDATELCKKLYSNPDKFEQLCSRVIKEWIYSCEHNLTNSSLNKIAWMGQAACALAHGISSDISGPAFSELDEPTQAIANRTALMYINYWMGLRGYPKLDLLGGSNVETQETAG